MPTSDLTKTDATTVRRKTERADYRRDSANAILDEALIAHVGFSVDGQPFVIPMVFGRDDDRLILHGSVASRLLRALDDGVPVCVTVTLIDALVASRSRSGAGSCRSGPRSALRSPTTTCAPTCTSRPRWRSTGDRGADELAATRYRY
jgi:hypothetical protein